MHVRMRGETTENTRATVLRGYKRNSVVKLSGCQQEIASELNVDNWNDNCEAKSEAKSPRPLRGLQVDFSLTRNVSYAVR